MRVCIIGTGKLALEGIDLVNAMGCEIVAIVTTEDHRQQTCFEDFEDRSRYGEVKIWNTTNVHKLKDQLAPLDLDIILVLGWGEILKASVLALPRLGCFAVHYSALPRYRGWAPLNWAILNRACYAGISLFKLDEGVDSGPIVEQGWMPIGQYESIGVLLDRARGRALCLLHDNLPKIEDHSVDYRLQDENEATYCLARIPEDGEIDWRCPVWDVHNLIRATSHPYPGAFTWLNGRRLRVWQARPVGGPRHFGQPGQVVRTKRNESAVVLCPDGLLELESVQLDGEAETSAGNVIRSLKTRLGK